MNSVDMRDSLLGCICGGAIGDAMGGLYEGEVRPKSVSLSRSASISDDTQLTLATCEAIQCGGRVEPEDVAERFLVWFRERRLSGLGASTLKALRDLEAGAHWALSGRSGEFSAGNGAAMRVAPLAYCLVSESSDDRRLLRDLCRITHRNEEAYAGAVAVVSAIRLIVSGVWIPGANLSLLVAGTVPDTNVRDALLVASALSPDTSIAEASGRLGSSGYVAESVPLAIFAAQQIEAVGFASLLEAVIGAGGDTDTIALMAGQIAGAFLGYENLPDCLAESVVEIDEVERGANALASRLYPDR